MRASTVTATFLALAPAALALPPFTFPFYSHHPANTTWDGAEAANTPSPSTGKGHGKGNHTSGSGSGTCNIINNVRHTFYGWPDNDPPGPGISHNCGSGLTAGGTGTWSDPLTMASANGEFDNCEVVYLPYLRKYVRYEDFCHQCNVDWQRGQTWHVDIWVGKNTDGGQEQIECENRLTVEGHAVVRNPRADLPTDSAALFAQNGCSVDHAYRHYDVNSFC